MSSILASFLAMIGIAVVAILAKAIGGRFLFRQPWPQTRSLVHEILISAVLTVVITLAICLVLVWTGFTDSQFYRPSTRNYGQHTKLGISPKDVFFESQDGTRLHGWFVPSSSEPKGTVIHFHGSDRNVSDTIENCYWLTDHGFNVFLFDYRGYGKSQGQPSRSGVVDDSVAAIEYVRSRPDVDADRIFLWGQSMGGQLAIVAADKAGLEGIQAVVAEATYASHSHHVKDKLAQMGPLWLVQWGAWLVTSDAYAARDVVGRLAPVHVLLVHGTADLGVRPYHSDWLFDAANEPKEIWRVEGAKHLDVFDDERHRERLVQYLQQSAVMDRSAPSPTGS